MTNGRPVLSDSTNSYSTVHPFHNKIHFGLFSLEKIL